MKTEATSTRKWIFLNRRRFYTNQPSVHMKPVNLTPKPNCFENALQNGLRHPSTRVQVRNMRFQTCRDSRGHGLNIIT